jgi:putative CocE/NonD family hydrolase
MNLTSHLLQRVFRLPPPATRALVVKHDLRVPMRDGAVLLADHWVPRSGAAGLPTALIRSPYGRRGMYGALIARPLAERGYQVLIQSTRGGFGSTGGFNPLRCEREDGLDTVDWVLKQPWFGGSIVLHGGSYLGFVQWAMADLLPPEVKAMTVSVSESALTLEFLRGDGFSLETPFNWGVMVSGQERRWAMLRQRFEGRRHHRALWTLPLAKADVAATGHRSDYIQEILADDATERWADIDHSGRVADVTVPVSSIGGWFDIFLPGQLRDFRALQDAGREPRLTVGPWPHVAPAMIPLGMRDMLDFGLAHARGDKPADRAPVRLFVMGENKWRDFPSWPPPGYEPRRLHLQPGGALSTGEPTASTPDGYRYDPADPTPALGGVRMALGNGKSGSVDNTKLEARPDVLTYTTAVLDEDVEVIGDVSAEIWFRSSLAHADVFVRLCDVDDKGRSHNVCDGLVSLTGADEVTRATVTMWPTAYRFRRGHRIRVQVSSGAFPRFNRNPGTGEPRGTATTLRAADQQVHHDPAYPSAVILPVSPSPRPA